MTIGIVHLPEGEWHKLTLLEPAVLLHITPGPGGEHRPLGLEPTRATR